MSDLTSARHEVQRDVESFHRALDIPVEVTPAIRRPELRAALIEEEAAETVEAIRRGDLVEAIDGLCDLLCVTYGAAAEFGIDLAPFWDEVHRTNMAKVGGPVRDDGKRLKPPGWRPPDITGILAALAAGRERGAVARYECSDCSFTSDDYAAALCHTMATRGSGDRDLTLGLIGDREGEHCVVVRVLALDEAEAAEIARERLVDVGVLAGPMHEAWKRLCEATS